MHSPVPLSIAKASRTERRRASPGCGSTSAASARARALTTTAAARSTTRSRSSRRLRRARSGRARDRLRALVRLVGRADAPRQRSARVDRVLLIAPSARFFGSRDDALRSARLHKTIFIGDRDEFCDVDEARALAGDLGADAARLRGLRPPFPEVATRPGRGGAARHRARGRAPDERAKTDHLHRRRPRRRRRERRPYDAVPMPIVQTSTYTFADTAEIAAFTEGRHPERGARRVRPLRQSHRARRRASASPPSRGPRTPRSSRAAWPR